MAVVRKTAPALDDFNGAPAEGLRPRLLALTSAASWVEPLLAARPYADIDSLLATSDNLVLGLDVSQIDTALAGHPRIGERSVSLDPESAARSTREQAGMSAANASLQEAMARGNAEYEQRFGRIYLVAAAGRSADDLYGFLQSRLDNDPETELGVVRRELARITRLRLTDMLNPSEANA